MNTMRKVGAIAAAILISGAALPALATASSAATLRTASKAPFGSYLADANGRAVYLFTADQDGVSHCYGACARAWPPVLVSGKPMAGSGIVAGMLGAHQRRDGTQQVTYHGMPLYYFAGDKTAESTAGQDIDHFGGSWYLVSPKGEKIEASAEKKSGSSW